MTEDMYKEQIIARFKQPQYRGSLKDPIIDIADSNPLCGDSLRFQLDIQDGIIASAVWQGEGCAISLASADILAEKMTGLTLDGVKQLTSDDVLDWLKIEIGPARMNCAQLALLTVQKVEK